MAACTETSRSRAALRRSGMAPGAASGSGAGSTASSNGGIASATGGSTGDTGSGVLTGIGSTRASAGGGSFTIAATGRSSERLTNSSSASSSLMPWRWAARRKSAIRVAGMAPRFFQP